MESQKIFDENGKELKVTDIVSKFLLDKSRDYNVNPNNLVVGLNYLTLHIDEYNEGSYQKWKTLEIIN